MDIQRYRDTHGDLDAGPAWLVERRQAALAAFEASGLPDRRVEAWRYSNPAAIGRIAWGHAAEGGEAGAIDGIEGAHSVLVVVNGRLDAERSRIGDLPEGAVVGSLAAHRDHPAVREHLGTVAGTSERAESFTALNEAFQQDGLVLLLPAGAEVGTIHLVIVASGQATVAHPRHLLVLGRLARATVVEEVLAETGETLTNTVTETVVGDGAALEHHLWHRGAEGSFVVRRVHARLGRDARVAQWSITTGGGWYRADLRAEMNAPGAETALKGLYLVGAGDHVDHHTRIDHVAPHCISRELFKGVVGGNGRAVFDGSIGIAEGARGSDSEQGCHNLLLSEKAEVDAKPELEIYNDDVRAAHGTTVGQLDAEQIWYMRTRGIGEDEARRMLIRAFVGEVVESVPEGLRGVVAARVAERLGELA